MPERGAAGSDAAGRVFRDAAGRSWRATFTNADDEGAIEFTCLGESREPTRVMATSTSFSFVGLTDDTLRNWLASAPRLGRLTE